jgi:large subunit ribosomal protein L5
MTQRLKQYYLEKVVPELKQKHNFQNMHEIPTVKKIVINRGIGEASQNSKFLDSCFEELSIISGQRGIIKRSKKAIASFKVRENMPIGISVTLRGDRMYAFLDRLINLALPRIRDFQGISVKSFDGHGNYSIGLEEQLMFPEIDYDQINQITGMDISIITTARKDEEAKSLLQALGMPFKN